VERHCHCQPSETARLAAGVILANWLDWFSDRSPSGGLVPGRLLVLAAACRVADSREPVTPCHGTQQGP